MCLMRSHPTNPSYGSHTQKCRREKSGWTLTQDNVEEELSNFFETEKERAKGEFDDEIKCVWCNVAQRDIVLDTPANIDEIQQEMIEKLDNLSHDSYNIDDETAEELEEAFTKKKNRITKMVDAISSNYYRELIPP